MINVVSFSGGLSSAFLVHEVKKIDKNADFIFMDTGAEHPKTYDFIKKVVNHFKIKLTCLRVVVNPVLGKANSYKEISINELKQDLQPFRDTCYKYGLPYVHGLSCTRTMKFEPFERYCNDKYGAGNYQRWLGIRADEPRRLKPKKGYSYLADISDFDKQDVIEWWKNQPFTLEIQEHLGNCVFCIKKSINKIALAALDEPEMAKNFIDLINDKSIRNSERGQQNLKIMYRGNNSLIGIMDMYKNQSREEILSRIKGSKSFETESCSESCEIFSCDID